ncbi:hypothetical protein D9758_009849 [Tetrapyrgos nigripes]|uniref:GST N-terminal domain-containing protein n=1 Tax=Tetrapyrgos nigripes TaxID=182062 RepID=A0A8H5GMQ5_9AGAR|nr:hypothetical protein D9758_009849 [Tetrapyrgos nigripes]
MITLYDVKSTLPPSDPRCGYSPFSWRVRFVLRFKGLSYKHHFLEYPDIEGAAKPLGAAPTATKPDSSPCYTVPFIHDSTTNKVISNSFDIVEYLDATYPDTIKMIPEETRLLQKVFADMEPTLIGQLHALMGNAFTKHASHLVTPRNMEVMTARGPLSVLTEQEEKENWDRIKNALGGLVKLMKDEDPFVMGKRVSLADAAVFGRLACIRWVWNEETDEWKGIMSWHGGRWSRLFEAYESLPEVERYNEAEIEA